VLGIWRRVVGVRGAESAMSVFLIGVVSCLSGGSDRSVNSNELKVV